MKLRELFWHPWFSRDKNSMAASRYTKTILRALLDTVCKKVLVRIYDESGREGGGYMRNEGEGAI